MQIWSMFQIRLREMSKVQYFTPKSRHLATEKTSQNSKIWMVTLKNQSRQAPITAHSGLPSSNAFGRTSTGPWGWFVYQQQKEQQPRGSWIKTKSLCMCLSFSQGALMVHSPFHLHFHLKQRSGLDFCACSELPGPPVSASCSASTHAPQSSAAPQRVPGTDGLISADKGAALKEARWKLSGLIPLSGAVNGR